MTSMERDEVIRPVVVRRYRCGCEIRDTSPLAPDPFVIVYCAGHGNADRLRVALVSMRDAARGLRELAEPLEIPTLEWARHRDDLFARFRASEQEADDALRTERTVPDPRDAAPVAHGDAPSPPLPGRATLVGRGPDQAADPVPDPRVRTPEREPDPAPVPASPAAEEFMPPNCVGCGGATTRLGGGWWYCPACAQSQMTIIPYPEGC